MYHKLKIINCIPITALGNVHQDKFSFFPPVSSLLPMKKATWRATDPLSRFEERYFLSAAVQLLFTFIGVESLHGPVVG